MSDPESTNDQATKPATLGDLSLEEQREVLSRTHIAWGTNGELEFKPAKEKRECEITPEGVSYSESLAAWYFRIRRGHEIQYIRIVKDDPRWEHYRID